MQEENSKIRGREQLAGASETLGWEGERQVPEIITIKERQDLERSRGGQMLEWLPFYLGHIAEMEYAGRESGL